MTDVQGYHAHVYADPATHGVAERLRDSLINGFIVEPNGFSDDPIAQFNVKFALDQFQAIPGFRTKKPNSPFTLKNQGNNLHSQVRNHYQQGARCWHNVLWVSSVSRIAPTAA